MLARDPQPATLLQRCRIESRTTHRLCVTGTTSKNVGRVIRTSKPQDASLAVRLLFMPLFLGCFIKYYNAFHWTIEAHISHHPRHPNVTMQCFPSHSWGKNRQEGCQVAIQLRVEHSSWLDELREEWARSFWVMSRDERSESG